MDILETADTFDLPDEHVWVVGDLHGNSGWIQTLLPTMRRHNPSLRTILQLGDHGFVHGTPGTHPVDYWAKRAGIDRVLVTLGNHEDWGPITEAQDAAPGQALRVSDVVWILPRPFRFRIAGRDVLSLGGASSVDKASRTPGRNWFEQELITEQMETDAIAGGGADLLLTHESPTQAVSAVRSILASNPFGFPDDALVVSAAQRERVQRVSDATQPAMHLHGHMHVYGELEHEDGRLVVSLARDSFAGNAGVLDMRTLEFEPLPMSVIRARASSTAPSTRGARDARVMDADNRNEPDTVVTSGAEFGPHAMAAALVKRPGLFMGYPPTRERATVFISGYNMALIAAGSSPSLLEEHRELLERHTKGGQATAEQELAHIRALLPVFEDLFAAAAQIKWGREND